MPEYRYAPPPGWPSPPDADWRPPEGWLPDPNWPPAPEGWAFWVAVEPAGLPAAPAARAPASPRANGPLGWMRRHKVLTSLVAFFAIGAVGAATDGPAPRPKESGSTSTVAPSQTTAPPASTPLPRTTASPASVSALPTAPPSTAPAPAATTAAPAPPPTVPGVGATDAYWEAHHQADTRFVAGSAYDPDPSIADDRFNARFYAVDHSSGRISNFSERFHSSTSLAIAQLRDRSLLPADAREIWRSKLPTCLQVQYRSAALARIDGAGGGILVSYSSSELEQPFTARKVVEAIHLHLLSEQGDASC